MPMEMMKMLPLLAQKDPDARRAAMADILHAAKLPYTVQKGQPDAKKIVEAENFLVKIGVPEQPCVLFCAHYDAVHGSVGANDNAAAVCMLAELAHALSARGITAEFAFFDGEENGRAGSRLYVREMDKQSVTAVVNVDLCGYGDTIVLMDKGGAKKAALSAFCGKQILQNHAVQAVKYLPESDDASFRGTQIPVINVAVVPRWDIQFLNALATYGGGLLGRPPEFDLILEQMEVTTTMHGGFRDTLENVQPQAVQRIYDYLLEAALAQPSQKKRTWFSK